MFTLNFINLKGGVGKTTVSNHIAYLLACEQNLKVLFIDADKQGNSSRFFNAAEAENSLSDLLMGEKPAKEVIHKTQYANIDIIPSDMSLAAANMLLIQNKCTRSDILKTALEKDGIDKVYDFCVIDNPPDISIPVINCLMVTDQVIIVTTQDAHSFDGVEKMLEQINFIKRNNPKIKLRGCLLNKYKFSITGNNTCKNYAESQNSTIKKAFLNTKIHLASPMVMNLLNRSISEGKTVHELSSRNRFITDLNRVTEELLGI